MASPTSGPRCAEITPSAFVPDESLTKLMRKGGKGASVLRAKIGVISDEQWCADEVLISFQTDCISD